MQNIPSHEKRIRMLFKAGTQNTDKPVTNNKIVLNISDQVFTENGWITCKDLNNNTKILVNLDTGIQEYRQVTAINISGKKAELFFI